MKDSFKLLGDRWRELGLPNDPEVYGHLLDVAQNRHIMVVCRENDRDWVEFVDPNEAKFDSIQDFILRLAQQV